MPRMTTMAVEGTAESIAACCRACRPPTRSSTIAQPPVSAPQVAITGRSGVKEPCEDSELRTKVFESAEEPQNRMTMMIVNVDASRERGRWSSRLKNEVTQMIFVAAKSVD